MVRLAIVFLLFSALLPRPSAAIDLTIMLPKAIEKHLSGTCENNEKFVVPPSFITQIDINGDNIKDYVLDYTEAGCESSRGGFCGTGGCSLVVFLGTKDDAVLALDDLVLAYDIYRYRGYSVAHVQGKYGIGIMRLSAKRPESLKSLPKGGQLVARNRH